MYEGPLRNAVHGLKYKRNIGLAESLSTHLVEIYKTLGWKIDLVVPVPLSNRRRLERGYNQANLLAYPMALTCQLPYSNHAMNRVRETRSQVGLTTGERQLNVKDAFTADPTIVRGKSVLVIDDVATTGATQQACASALMGAGASTVYGLTLARAVFHNETAGETQTSDHPIF
jgi:competence protein ComFC